MKKEKKTDSVIITRKIELRILESDESKINECYQRLFDWRRDVCIGANMVVNHQYFNFMFKSQVKNRLDVDSGEKTKDWKVDECITKLNR